MTAMLPLLFALMSAPAQHQEPPPPACIGASFVSWQACAEAAREGTAAYSLAMINLGTEAYLNGDLSAALIHYDKGRLDGQEMTSDVIFHAFRGDALRFGGRMEEARADARIAWNYLDGQPPMDIPTDLILPVNDELRGAILSIILPIMKDDDSGEFRRARDQYLALPARDWTALSQRSGVLISIGDLEGAVRASKAALDLRPQDPLSHNNHCYALAEAGRPAEALSHCESAVAGLPEIAAVRHSLASTLARLGRCADAEAQLAQARRMEPEAALYREPLTCTPKA